MPTNNSERDGLVERLAFSREERFIVVKRKHLTPAKEDRLRAFLHTEEIGTVECVVVESDWPEYETVWQMIEARFTGTAAYITALRDQLADTQMLATKWMQAHDKLKAGLPYSFPAAADLPEAVTTLEADNARMREALEWYGDTFCEGFCEGEPEWAKFGDDKCSGCRAFAALNTETDNATE